MVDICAPVATDPRVAHASSYVLPEHAADVRRARIGMDGGGGGSVGADAAAGGGGDGDDGGAPEGDGGSAARAGFVDLPPGPGFTPVRGGRRRSHNILGEDDDTPTTATSLDGGGAVAAGRLDSYASMPSLHGSSGHSGGAPLEAPHPLDQPLSFSSAVTISTTLRAAIARRRAAAAAAAEARRLRRGAVAKEIAAATARATAGVTFDAAVHSAGCAR